MATVGIDTGGTFTDFWVEGRVLKVRSTPKDPSLAVLEGLSRLRLPEPLRIVHGTTVGTNALLTRSLARTAFLTTEGLEDLLQIGRQERIGLYAPEPRAHDPIVAPGDRHGVRERIGPDGSVEIPLGIPDLRPLLAGVEAAAVCLLHAWRNPAHEERLGEALSRLGIPFSLSSRVANEFREFERAATTVVNASLLPVLGPYLKRMRGGVGGAALEILQSNGGTATAGEVAELPVKTVLSGPAGGVVAAADAARRHGIEGAVSFDMGGTSTDVALLRGAPETVPEFRIGGLPLRVPVLDIHTVGAGGGSIAWQDAMGALRVGPRSAGADPGPACYGTGEEATVTDAHAVLGNLLEEDPLAGTLRIDAGRARRAVGDRAAAILRVADATMERALRQVTVRRGVSPKGLTLVAFGGAGPLHACSLADALRMRDVLVPRDPGAFSASGMATAPRRRDFVRTVLLPAEDCVARLAELLRPMRGHGAAREVLVADARYAGQSHELRVPAAPDLVERFHEEHARAYGFCDRSRRVEVVNLRVAALDPAPEAPPHPPRREVRARRGPARMERAALDGAIHGPVVLHEPTATTVVPAGWRATALAGGDLLLERA